MKDSLDKLLDELSEKVIKDSNLEAPSIDFTANIMSKINVATKQSESTIYQPLISRKTWLLIGIIIIIIVACFVLGTNSESIGWFANVDFNLLSSINLTKVFTKMSFSKTVLYAIVFLTIMLFIQIPLLKRHFDKEINFE